jgi:Holliday junction resolvase-like predicted endonuclease
MKKSTRHSKITGDFAEALVLYWLSKYGYECARVDHTGIDLIARNPSAPEVMGISVKCRSRYKGTEKYSVNLPPGDFEKVRRACEAFVCVPYYAVVVDGPSVIHVFLTPHSHVLAIAGGKPDGMRYWQMGDQDLEAYRLDPLVQRFELHTAACSWRDRPAQ